MEKVGTEQALEDAAERLNAAAVKLESVIAGIEEQHLHACGDVHRIVATADGAFGDERDTLRLELERKLNAAEQMIASLQAQIGSAAIPASRRTTVASPVQMFSKTSLENAGVLEAGGLDAALSGLSLEQRIAVKAKMARAGMLS